MEAFPDHYHGRYKPQPFRSNPLDANGSPRVSSNPESTTSKTHLHGPLRHHHHKHHRHGSRHAKNVVQSATQLYPPTSFGDLLKQVSRSRNSSPTRNSRNVEQLDGPQGNEAKVRRPKPASPEDVAREKLRAKTQEEALLSSLHSLSDKSLKTSRRLDDTYYSILEKLAVLRQTIGSLQELSGLTKELHDTFLFDTKELTKEIQGQIKSFDNFDAQETQMKELQKRVQLGKEKADALMNRLAAARRRVEARAKSDAEGEARSTRRFRTFWGILGAIVCIVFIIIICEQLNSTSAGKEAPQELESGVRLALADAPIPDKTKEAIVSPVPVRAYEPSIPFPPAPSDRKEDVWTRVFDEL